MLSQDSGWNCKGSLSITLLVITVSTQLSTLTSFSFTCAGCTQYFNSSQVYFKMLTERLKEIKQSTREENKTKTQYEYFHSLNNSAPSLFTGFKRYVLLACRLIERFLMDG